MNLLSRHINDKLIRYNMRKISSQATDKSDILTVKKDKNIITLLLLFFGKKKTTKTIKKKSKIAL